MRPENFDGRGNTKAAHSAMLSYLVEDSDVFHAVTSCAIQKLQALVDEQEVVIAELKQHFAGTFLRTEVTIPETAENYKNPEYMSGKVAADASTRQRVRVPPFDKLVEIDDKIQRWMRKFNPDYRLERIETRNMEGLVERAKGTKAQEDVDRIGTVASGLPGWRADQPRATVAITPAGATVPAKLTPFASRPLNAAAGTTTVYISEEAKTLTLGGAGKPKVHGSGGTQDFGEDSIASLDIELPPGELVFDFSLPAVTGTLTVNASGLLESTENDFADVSEGFYVALGDPENYYEIIMVIDDKTVLVTPSPPIGGVPPENWKMYRPRNFVFTINNPNEDDHPEEFTAVLPVADEVSTTELFNAISAVSDASFNVNYIMDGLDKVGVEIALPGAIDDSMVTLEGSGIAYTSVYEGLGLDAGYEDTGSAVSSGQVTISVRGTTQTEQVPAGVTTPQELADWIDATFDFVTVGVEGDTPWVEPSADLIGDNEWIEVVGAGFIGRAWGTASELPTVPGATVAPGQATIGDEFSGSGSDTAVPYSESFPAIGDVDTTWNLAVQLEGEKHWAHYRVASLGDGVVVVAKAPAPDGVAYTARLEKKLWHIEDQGTTGISEITTNTGALEVAIGISNIVALGKTQYFSVPDGTKVGDYVVPIVYGSAIITHVYQNTIVWETTTVSVLNGSVAELADFRNSYARVVKITPPGVQNLSEAQRVAAVALSRAAEGMTLEELETYEAELQALRSTYPTIVHNNLRAVQDYCRQVDQDSLLDDLEHGDVAAFFERLEGSSLNEAPDISAFLSSVTGMAPIETTEEIEKLPENRDDIEYEDSEVDYL